MHRGRQYDDHKQVNAVENNDEIDDDDDEEEEDDDDEEGEHSGIWRSGSGQE